ncbi:MAG: LemA family protein [Candidatus Gracilibacteria bacterium]|nr:LemA family protein [Candidatus Gracilibacteria bacterium]
MKKTLIGFLAVIVLVGSWAVGSYNGLVTMDVAVDESWSQVEVQYQRRFDLIPSLVETVKGVAGFEKDTYTAVTEARSAWAQAKESGDRGAQVAAGSSFDSALSRLLVTVENYPQLKANENFSTLQAQIEGTENRVSVARRDFNQVVKPYNTKVKTFPTLLFAKLFGFDEESFFESKAGSDEAPEIKF